MENLAEISEPEVLPNEQNFPSEFIWRNYRFRNIC